MGFLYLLPFSVGIVPLQDKSEATAVTSISLDQPRRFNCNGNTKSPVVLPTLTGRLCLRVSLEKNPIMQTATCSLSYLLKPKTYYMYRQFNNQ
jgi:hypothetical protein